MRKADVFLVSTHRTTAVCQAEGGGSRTQSSAGRGWGGSATCVVGSTFEQLLGPLAAGGGRRRGGDGGEGGRGGGVGECTSGSTLVSGAKSGLDGAGRER